MNEVVQLLVDRTGLPEDKAEAAVGTVVGFLKEKLPPSVGSQLDNLVSGEPGGGFMDKISGMGAGLGGMFGRKE